MAELKLENVRCSYKDKVVLDDVTFTITDGVVALLGSNGAGKTTLIKNILRLIYPEKGSVSFNGTNVNKLGSKYYDYVGYMPQMPNFYNNFRADDFLVYMASLKGIKKREAKAKADKLLEMVQLTDVRRKKIGTFSGGMKQRLGIAQALLNEPQLMILDEPTAGLDPNERIRFRNIITQIASTRIVILATHIIPDVESIAKTMLLVKDGRVTLCDKPQEFIDAIKNKVYLYKTDDYSQAENIVSNYKVSNMREREDGYELRIISDTKPFDEAEPTEPNLEDAFLVYFSK